MIYADEAELRRELWQAATQVGAIRGARQMRP